MTKASCEFQSVVIARMKQKLPLKVSVALSIITLMWTAAFVLFFFAPSLFLKAVSYIAGLAGAAIYAYTLKTYSLKPYDYLKITRSGIKDVQNDMAAKMLPLSLVGDAIKEDIEGELKRIENVKARYFEFSRKLINVLVVVPGAFLFGLLFQALFNAENIANSENLYAALEMILLIIGVLLLVCLFIIVLYIPIGYFIKHLNGETDLRFCLDVFREIEISEKARCDCNVNGMDLTKHNE